MSAGHRHKERHSAALQAEYKKLLAEPDVAAYLSRPHKEVFTYHIPLTGGSSLDGRSYYGDPAIPKDLRPFVMWHERTEKAFRDVKKMSYDRAHNLATIGERLLVEKKGRSWEQYKRQIGAIVRKEETPKGELPPDLDLGPYKESGMTDLLAGNKKPRV